MAIENVVCPPIVADWKAKRSALDALIAAYENAQASGALGQAGDTPPTQSNDVSALPVDLPLGALRKSSIPAGIKLYLAAVKKNQTSLEITSALKDNGMETTSKDFGTVVRAAIFKLKRQGVLLRFKDGWQLAENFNESLRKRLVDAQDTKRPVKTKRKVQKKKAAPQPVQVRSSVVADAKPPLTVVADGLGTASGNEGAQVLIEAYFAKHVGQAFSCKEIASALNIGRSQTVAVICSKLAHKGIFEKTPERMFRLPKVEAMAKAG